MELFNLYQKCLGFPLTLSLVSTLFILISIFSSTLNSESSEEEMHPY